MVFEDVDRDKEGGLYLSGIAPWEGVTHRVVGEIRGDPE
jgi:hypothetical protein